jgi:hypothetical protein
MVGEAFGLEAADTFHSEELDLARPDSYVADDARFLFSAGHRRASDDLQMMAPRSSSETKAAEVLLRDAIAREPDNTATMFGVVIWFTSAARGLSYQCQSDLSFGARVQSGFLHGPVDMDDSNLIAKRGGQLRDQPSARLRQQPLIEHRRPCVADHG